MTEPQPIIYELNITTELIERRWRVCDFYDINNLSAPLPDFCERLGEDEVCQVDIIGKIIEADFRIDPRADMPKTVTTPDGGVLTVYEKDCFGNCKGRARIIFEKEEQND